MMTPYPNRSLLNRLAKVFYTVIMFFGLVAAPSFAGGLFGTEPSDAPMPNIMKDAEDIANPNKQPMSLAEIQARTNGGLNEIQGTADIDKMIDKSQPGKPDSEIVQELDEQVKKSTK